MSAMILENTMIGPPLNIENVSRNGVGLSATSIMMESQFTGFDLRISIQKGQVDATLNGKRLLR